MKETPREKLKIIEVLLLLLGSLGAFDGNGLEKAVVLRNPDRFWDTANRLVEAWAFVTRNAVIGIGDVVAREGWIAG